MTAHDALICTSLQLTHTKITCDTAQTIIVTILELIVRMFIIYKLV